MNKSKLSQQAVEFHAQLVKAGLTADLRDYVIASPALASLTIMFLKSQLTQERRLQLDSILEHQVRATQLKALHIKANKARWPGPRLQAAAFVEPDNTQRISRICQYQLRQDITPSQRWVLVPYYNSIADLVDMALFTHAQQTSMLSDEVLSSLPKCRLVSPRKDLYWELIDFMAYPLTAPAAVPAGKAAGLGVLAAIMHSISWLQAAPRSSWAFNLGDIECRERGKRKWDSVLSLRVDRHLSLDFDTCNKQRASQRRFNPTVIERIKVE